jgi:hypothetical protein
MYARTLQINIEHLYNYINHVLYMRYVMCDPLLYVRRAANRYSTENYGYEFWPPSHSQLMHDECFIHILKKVAH